MLNPFCPRWVCASLRDHTSCYPCKLLRSAFLLTNCTVSYLTIKSLQHWAWLQPLVLSRELLAMPSRRNLKIHFHPLSMRSRYTDAINQPWQEWCTSKFQVVGTGPSCIVIYLCAPSNMSNCARISSMSSCETFPSFTNILDRNSPRSTCLPNVQTV